MPPADRMQESYTVDFKEKWNDDAIRVVAAFANTFGGLLFVGVAEDFGKPKDIVGEQSGSELTTRIAGAISASITPTPSYDIAECEVPGKPSQRVAVIRIRPGSVLHFTVKSSLKPVYVRNADQAIPAPAAELQSLIAKQIRNTAPSDLGDETTSGLNQLLFLSEVGGEPNLGLHGKFYNDSLLIVTVVPTFPTRAPLDWNTEARFQAAIRTAFPTWSFEGDQTWSSDNLFSRSSKYYETNLIHMERGLQSKWVLTNTGAFGFTTYFSNRVEPPPNLWSLPDLAYELVSCLKCADAIFRDKNYFGDADVRVWIRPGDSVLFTQGDLAPFIRYCSGKALPWRFPYRPARKLDGLRSIFASASCNFSTRTSEVGGLVAGLLNDVLREQTYPCDITELKSLTASLTVK